MSPRDIGIIVSSLLAMIVFSIDQLIMDPKVSAGLDAILLGLTLLLLGTGLGLIIAQWLPESCTKDKT
jgi:hypothetical protein